MVIHDNATSSSTTFAVSVVGYICWHWELVCLTSTVCVHGCFYHQPFCCSLEACTMYCM